MAGSRKIELVWRCSSCGHENLGRHEECQRCGNPKDASERYEMPGSAPSTAVPSVTDPALLRAAHAGPDWRCTYCATDNRALSAACVQCGAQRGTTPGVAHGHRVGAPPSAAVPPRPIAQQPAIGSGWVRALAPLAVIASIALTCFGGMVWALIARRPAPAALVQAPVPQPEILPATIASREWQTSLRVMRRRIVEREGFAESQPPGAFDVRPHGSRHHHDEQVPDGTTTESYFESVPYEDSETYTERVPCGEDCTEHAPVCTEHCTDDGNGFASCSTQCSGGGRTCTPRMCSETRTRQVTRTRQEPRTRQVPRFRSEPRDAPWMRWRIWEWLPDREAERHGGAEDATWPEESELGEGAPLEEGEEERIDRSFRASVVIRDARGREHTMPLHALEDLARYRVGASMVIEVDPYGRFLREIAAPSLDAGAAAAP